MADFPEWAAFVGMAGNKAYPVEERWALAMRAIELIEVEMSHIRIEVADAKAAKIQVVTGVPDDAPQAWKDLVEALTLMSKGQSNSVSPTHCEHDELRVMADPHKFTSEERLKLDKLGFFVDGHDNDDSDGDEGQGTVDACNGEDCDTTFLSFRFGSA